LEIRGNIYTENNSKEKLNKPYDNYSKINMTQDFSIIDNESNTLKDNITININDDINTTQPRNKFTQYFKKKITKKRILLNNASINHSNNKDIIRRAINKSNIISFYNTFSITDNNTNNNRYINNYKDKKEPNKTEKIKDIIKNKKQQNNNNNKILHQPQLCITNINFYNYVNDVQKNTLHNNLISYTYTNPSKKTMKKISLNNNNNNNNNDNMTKKDNSYNEQYTPFDLNSILVINKCKNIKFLIIKELNLRKINYKINHNNNSDLSLKFTCFKSQMRFELNTFLYQENSENYIFIINALKKGGNMNTFKYKNLINKLLNKIQ
jgi:hypothetical protein